MLISSKYGIAGAAPCRLIVMNAALVAKSIADYIRVSVSKIED